MSPFLGNSSIVTGPAFWATVPVLGGKWEEKVDIWYRTLEEWHSEHTVSSLLNEVDCRRVNSFWQSSQ